MAVTFPTALGGNGNTYNNDSFLSNGHELYFLTICDQVVVMASSASSSAILSQSLLTQSIANAAIATSAAQAAASSAAGLAGISISDDILSAACNAQLGACAFMSVEQLPLFILPVVLSGVYTVVPANFGVVILSAGYTVTLPVNAQLPTPWAIVIKNTHASSALTVAIQGSDTVDGASSVTLAAGVSKQFIKSAAGAFVSL